MYLKSVLLIYLSFSGVKFCYIIFTQLVQITLRITEFVASQMALTYSDLP